MSLRRYTHNVYNTPKKQRNYQQQRPTALGQNNNQGSSGSTKRQQAVQEINNRLNNNNNNNNDDDCYENNADILYPNHQDHQQQAASPNLHHARSTSSVDSAQFEEAENYLGQHQDAENYLGQHQEPQQEQEQQQQKPTMNFLAQHHANYNQERERYAAAPYHQQQGLPAYNPATYNNYAYYQHQQSHTPISVGAVAAVTAETHIRNLTFTFKNTRLVHDCLLNDLHQVLGLDACMIPFVPLTSVQLYQQLIAFTQADYQKFYCDSNGQPTVKTCNIYVGQLPLVHQPVAPGTGTEVPYLRWLVSLSGVKPLRTEIRRGQNKKAPIGIVTVPEHEADKIIAFLHKRCLITQCGVYIAATREQIKVLHYFCYDMLKHKDDARFQHRPYTPLTVAREIDHDLYVQCRNDKKPEQCHPLCPHCAPYLGDLCPLEIRNENPASPSPFGYLFNTYLPAVCYGMTSHFQQMPSHAYISPQALNKLSEHERKLYAYVKDDTMRICNEKAWKFWKQRGGCQTAVDSKQYEVVCATYLQEIQQQLSGVTYYHHQ